MRKVIGLVAAGAIGIAGTALAQQPGPQPAQPLPATTVQLPTFSYFTVNTTVSVPDRGGAYLGGINRARDSSWSRGFGPLANRGIGSDRMASGVSVHATIIDHEELDRAVLAEAAARRVPADPAVAKAEAISRHVADDASAAAGVPSGTRCRPRASLQSRLAMPPQPMNATAKRLAYFAKAQAAEAEGKPAVAKIYYQMVTRRDTGSLKQRAESRLATLAKVQGATVAKR